MKRTIIILSAILLATSMNAFAQTARVQVIHNSADLAAQTVDVWLDNTLLLDDFQFRTASPFVDAPAGVQFTVGIAPSTSTSAGESIATFNYTLTAGETYVLVADGIVSPTGYTPATPFDIAVYAMGREVASNMSNTDVLVHHGSTDAPIVDVVEVGVGAGTIIDNAAYGDFAGYLELPTDDYTLEIRDSSSTVTVVAYDAPLATLGLNGAAAVVVASGFLNPANNSNGPSFGLWAALPTGGNLVELPLASLASLEEGAKSQISLYPNPSATTLNVDLGEENYSEIKIYSNTGTLYIEKAIETKSAVSIDISALPVGNYFLVLSGDQTQQIEKFVKQ